MLLNCYEANMLWINDLLVLSNWKDVPAQVCSPTPGTTSQVSPILTSHHSYKLKYRESMFGDGNVKTNLSMFEKYHKCNHYCRWPPFNLAPFEASSIEALGDTHECSCLNVCRNFYRILFLGWLSPGGAGWSRTSWLETYFAISVT